MSNSKIFVLPTYYEGYGMALLESSIAGLKTITTDLPVLREVLKNRDVDFIPKDDINLLANSISKSLYELNNKIYEVENIDYSWEKSALEFKRALYG